MTASIPAPRWGFGEFAFLSGSTAIYQGARFVAVLWAARVLSHEDMGLWNTAQTIALYAASLQLGVFNGMNIEVPYRTGTGESDRAVHVESVTIATLLAVATAIAVGTFLVGIVYRPSAAGMTASQVMLTGALCVAQLAFLYVHMRVSARMRFGQLATLQLTAGVLALALTIWLVRSWGLSGLLAASAIAWLVAALLQWGRWAREVIPRWDTSEIRRLAAVGSPILLAGFTQSLMTSVDRWVLLNGEGTATLGLYTLPIIIFGGLSVLANVMSQQFYPRMARVYGETHRRSALRPMAMQQMVMSVAGTAVVAIVIAIVLRPLIELFLPRYTAGIGAALALLPGATALGIAGVAGNVLVVVGERRKYLLTLCGGVLLALVLESIAQRAGTGIVGVAASASVAYFLTALAVGWMAWIALGSEPAGVEAAH